jgi:hypothetical protein
MQVHWAAYRDQCEGWCSSFRLIINTADEMNRRDGARWQPCHKQRFQMVQEFNLLSNFKVREVPCQESELFPTYKMCVLRMNTGPLTTDALQRGNLPLLHSSQLISQLLTSNHSFARTALGDESQQSANW